MSGQILIGIVCLTFGRSESHLGGKSVRLTLFQELHDLPHPTDGVREEYVNMDAYMPKQVKFVRTIYENIDESLPRMRLEAPKSTIVPDFAPTRRTKDTTPGATDKSGVLKFFTAETVVREEIDE